jgi:hypothetical protein
MYPLTRAAWFAAALVVIVPATGRAQPTRIALSGDTPAPAPAPGVGPFTSFDHAPSVSGGVVAFRGLYAGGEGVYQRTAAGNLVRIASSPSPAPGGGTFGSFGPPTVSGTSVLFAAGTSGAPPQFGIPFRGVYAAHASGLVTVADLTTASPTGGNFIGFSPPAVSGTTAAFYAGSATVGGIYTRSTSGTGAVTRVADTSPATSIPGVGGPFGGIVAPPAISGTRVAFTGFGPLGGGVFTAASPGGPLTAVATTATPIPGGSGNFVNFGAPAVSGSVVAFAGGPTGGPGSFPTGIYANTGAGGSLVRVANTSTPVPGNPSLRFTQFDPFIGLVGDDLVFVGHSSAGEGIYTNATGQLTRVVGQGDVFDSRTVADVEIGPQSFDGTIITFWASFTDGRSGIYVVPVVPVPEPAGLLAVAAVGAGLLRRVRRRRAGAADHPVTSRP